MPGIANCRCSRRGEDRTREPGDRAHRQVLNGASRPLIPGPGHRCEDFFAARAQHTCAAVRFAPVPTGTISMTRAKNYVTNCNTPGPLRSVKSAAKADEMTGIRRARPRVMHYAVERTGRICVQLPQIAPCFRVSFRNRPVPRLGRVNADAAQAIQRRFPRVMHGDVTMHSSRQTAGPARSRYSSTVKVVHARALRRHKVKSRRANVSN